MVAAWRSLSRTEGLVERLGFPAELWEFLFAEQEVIPYYAAGIDAFFIAAGDHFFILVPDPEPLAQVAIDVKMRPYYRKRLPGIAGEQQAQPGYAIKYKAEGE